MSKIVGEAEVLQQQEIRDQRRRQIFGRVRGIFVGLFLLTILVTAFCYRAPLQEFVTSKLNKKPSQTNGHRPPRCRPPRMPPPPATKS